MYLCRTQIHIPGTKSKQPFSCITLIVFGRAGFFFLDQLWTHSCTFKRDNLKLVKTFFSLLFTLMIILEQLWIYRTEIWEFGEIMWIRILSIFKYDWNWIPQINTQRLDTSWYSGPVSHCAAWAQWFDLFREPPPTRLRCIGAGGGGGTHICQRVCIPTRCDLQPFLIVLCKAQWFDLYATHICANGGRCRLQPYPQVMGMTDVYFHRLQYERTTPPPTPTPHHHHLPKSPTVPSSRPIRSGLSHRKVGSPPGQLTVNQSQMFSPSGTARRTTQGVPPCSPRHPGPSLNPRSGFIALRLCHRMNNWITSGKTRHVV